MDDFLQLARALGVAHATLLSGKPSKNALAKLTERSPTTVDKWLKGYSFPSQIDGFLTIVHEVEMEAKRRKIDLGTLVDKEIWRNAHDRHQRRLAVRSGAASQSARALANLTADIVGVPVTEYANDPHILGVRRAPKVGHQSLVDPSLPPYVRRKHDDELASVVDAAACGRSGFAVLVGDPGSGKTRACWEAVRSLGEDWLLWHPIAPTWEDALLNGLGRLRSKTVIWLDEGQRYLSNPQVAAWLLKLLSDRSVCPVLMVATLWPARRGALIDDTLRDNSGSAVGDLIEGRSIAVPTIFIPLNVSELQAATQRDPRMAVAAAEAPHGALTQYLAGIPALVERYRYAAPAIRALTNAAIDARRLGVHDIPVAFVKAAASGYLTPEEWRAVRSSNDWLNAALDAATEPGRGTPGLLDEDPEKPGIAGLTPYVEQLGAFERRAVLPPKEFWSASAHLAPADMARLAAAAQARGMYRLAARLAGDAVLAGSVEGADLIYRLVERFDPAAAAEVSGWLASHVSVDKGWPAALIRTFQKAGHGAATAVLVRRAAEEITFDDPTTVAYFLEYAVSSEDQALVSAFVQRFPRAGLRVAESRKTAHLLRALFGARELVGDYITDHARQLAQRSLAARVDRDVLLFSSAALSDEVWWRETARKVVSQSSSEKLADVCRLLGAEDLLRLDIANRVNLDDDFRTCQILGHLHTVGATEALATLIDRLHSHAPAQPSPWPLHLRQAAIEMGCDKTVVDRLPQPSPDITLELDDKAIRDWFFQRMAGTPPRERAALRSQLACAAYDVTTAAVLVLVCKELATWRLDSEISTVLADRVAKQITNVTASELVSLVEFARDIGDIQLVSAFADITAVLEIAMEADRVLGTWSLRKLLGLLVEAGQTRQAAALAARMAEDIDLADPGIVATLLDTFGECGFPELRRRLLSRNPIAFPEGLARFALKYSAADLLRILTALGEPALALQFANQVLESATGAKMARNAATVLVEIGHPDLAAELIRKAADSGFYWVLAGSAAAHEFPYGREPSGTPSPHWDWENIHISGK